MTKFDNLYINSTSGNSFMRHSDLSEAYVGFVSPRTDITLKDYCRTGDPMDLYDYIYSYIKNNNTTIGECGVNIGVTRNVMSDYMYGKRRMSIDKVFALAIYLHIDPDELDWLIMECASETPTQIRKIINGNDHHYKDIYENVKLCLKKKEDGLLYESYDWDAKRFNAA